MHVVQGCCRISASVGFYMQIGCFYERNRPRLPPSRRNEKQIFQKYIQMFLIMKL